MLRNRFDFVKYDIPDDGAGGIDLEGVLETDESQEEELFFLEGDPDIPQVEEEIPEDSPEMQALKDQNALLQQRMASLETQADSTAALTKGLENLGQNLRQPVPQQAQQPVDKEAAKKDFNDKFYDHPADSLDEFARAKIEPALQQMMLTNADLSKQLLTVDPERSETYKKYKTEIDEVFNQIPMQKKIQNPTQAAKDAADLVASRHLPETRATMKEEILKEVMAELKGETTPVKQTAPVQHSESGLRKAPKGKTRSTVLPNKVWQYAGTMGYQGRGEQADQARVYQWWKEGTLIVPGCEYK